MRSSLLGLLVLVLVLSAVGPSPALGKKKDKVLTFANQTFKVGANSYTIRHGKDKFILHFRVRADRQVLNLFSTHPTFDDAVSLANHLNEKIRAQLVVQIDTLIVKQLEIVRGKAVHVPYHKLIAIKTKIR